MLILVLISVLFSFHTTAADCVIRYENGTVLPTPSLITFSLDEDAAQGTVLTSLSIDDPSYVLSCANLDEALACNYINILERNATSYDVVLQKAIGDNYDNGVLSDVISVRLDLVCPGPTTGTFKAYFLTIISPKNTHAPEFSSSLIEVELEQSIPLGLDFSQYFSGISVADLDKSSAKVSFSVDSDDFQVLPAWEVVNCQTGQTTYYPRRLSRTTRKIWARNDVIHENGRIDRSSKLVYVEMTEARNVVLRLWLRLE